jgi:hypothetical protein
MGKETFIYMQMLWIERSCFERLLCAYVWKKKFNGDKFQPLTRKERQRLQRMEVQFEEKALDISLGLQAYDPIFPTPDPVFLQPD